MDLSRLTYRIGELRKPSGDRLTSDIKEFVNLAIRYVCERQDWGFMRGIELVTIASGTTFSLLPENFKRLTSEQSPVSYSDAVVTAGFPVPVNVFSREQMQGRGWWPLTQWNVAATTFLPSFGVYINLDQGTPTINIPQNIAATNNLQFSVSGYFYPPDLVKATDHNAVTDHGVLSDAIINLAKAFAYEAEDPADPRAQACRTRYEAAEDAALYNDLAVQRGGRNFHM